MSKPKSSKLILNCNCLYPNLKVLFEELGHELLGKLVFKVNRYCDREHGLKEYTISLEIGLLRATPNHNSHSHLFDTYFTTTLRNKKTEWIKYEMTTNMATGNSFEN